MNAADRNFTARHDQFVAPELLDWTELAQREPEPPVFLAEPLFPEGESTLLSGHGGVHKSRLCKQFAVSCGLGVDFFGLPIRQRKVAYFSFEDDEKTLHRNFAAICKMHGRSLLDLKGRVYVFDGTRSDSVIFSEQIDGYLTGLYSWVKSRVADTGAEVVIIDGIADVYAANESDRALVSRTHWRPGERRATKAGPFAGLPTPDCRDDPPPSGTGGKTRSPAWASVKH